MTGSLGRGRGSGTMTRSLEFTLFTQPHGLVPELSPVTRNTALAMGCGHTHLSPL